MTCKDDKSKSEERDYKFNAENELERSSFLDAVKKCKLAEQEKKSAAEVSNSRTSSLMDMEIAMGEVIVDYPKLMPITLFWRLKVDDPVPKSSPQHTCYPQLDANTNSRTLISSSRKPKIYCRKRIVTRMQQ